jgi:hypothetical protein
LTVVFRCRTLSTIASEQREERKGVRSIPLAEEKNAERTLEEWEAPAAEQTTRDVFIAWS